MGMSNIAAADELSQIRRAATGDHAAFALLVRRYEARIVIYLRQTLGDADLASDLAQETFLAAYQALPRWQPPPPNLATQTTDLLSPWLYRIATNYAISALRRQTMSARRAPAPPARARSSLEDAVIGRELLRAAIATLDEDDAACLVLHYVAGERYGEIAARLGISGEAVRKRVGRALSSLRRAYAALETEAQP